MANCPICKRTDLVEKVSPRVSQPSRVASRTAATKTSRLTSLLAPPQMPQTSTKRLWISVIFALLATGIAGVLFLIGIAAAIMRPADLVGLLYVLVSFTVALLFLLPA